MAKLQYKNRRDEIIEEMALYEMVINDFVAVYDDIKNLSLIKEDHNILSITRDVLSAIKIGNEALLEDLNSKLLLISKKSEDYKKIYFELICEISKGTYRFRKL